MTRLPVHRCGIGRRRVRCCALGVWSVVAGAGWSVAQALPQVALPRDVVVVARSDAEVRPLWLPLQHCGLRPRLVSSAAECARLDPARLVGVLSWFRAGEAVPPGLWAAAQGLAERGQLRWVHLGSLEPLRAAAGTPSLQRWLAGRGLDWAPRARARSERIELRRAEHTAFEAAPVMHRVHVGPRGVGPGDRSWVTTVERGAGSADERTAHPVVTGAWGGLALDPYFNQGTIEREVLAAATDGPWVEPYRFHVDPFRFIRAAFGLGARPVPDPNVRHGHRVAYHALHRPAGGGRAPDADELERWLAAQLRPWTVFSDVSNLPAHCERAVQLDRPEAIRDAGRFAMVCWSTTQSITTSQVGLPEAVLSASADPSVNRLDSVYRTVGHLAPLWVRAATRTVGVAGAPTDVAMGTFRESTPTAFEQLGATFDNTGRPRILEPLAVHVDARVIVDPIRARSLQRVLAKVGREQPVTVPWSEHAAAVACAARAEVLAIDGGFALRGFAFCRTVRLDDEADGAALPIDWSRSPGVLGVSRIGDARYVYLDASAAELRLAPNAPAAPHLVGSTAVIEAGRRSADAVELTLRAAVGTESRHVVVGGFSPAATVTVTIGDRSRDQVVPASGRIALDVAPGATELEVTVR